MMAATAARRLLLLLAAILLGTGLAHAGSPLGVGTAEPSFSVGGPFGRFFLWINEHQQSFYRALTGALGAMRQDPSALWSLIGLSFAYGIFHAAGPGHGKAVVTSYLLANERQLKRGVVIAFAASVLQALVALAVVLLAWLVLRGTGITLTQATDSMEIASFGLVIAFGVWLLMRKLRELLPPRRQTVTSGLFAGSSGIGTTTGPTGLSFSATEIDHSHDALSVGEACPDCGVTHLPDPAKLGGERLRWNEALSAVIAVGLRPCSGALIVLTFSMLNQLYLGGVLSVFAMALGTAITVSALAVLAVTAKDWAIRLTAESSRGSRLLSHSIEIVAALCVIALGAVLLMAALQS